MVEFNCYQQLNSIELINEFLTDIHLNLPRNSKDSRISI